jgi:hypothetical protein
MNTGELHMDEDDFLKELEIENKQLRVENEMLRMQIETLLQEKHKYENRSDRE